MYTSIEKQKTYLISDRTGKPLYWLVHESPVVEEGQNLLDGYLTDARTIFRQECDMLLDTRRVFTTADSDRLTVMLELLIEARRTWQEEELMAHAAPVSKKLVT